MNTPLFLNIDVSTAHNSNKSVHQVVHVETDPDAIFVIGACFSVQGEQKLGDGRNYYDEVILTNLVLRNLVGQKKRIISASLEERVGFDYHFIIEIENHDKDNQESSLDTNLKFKKCISNSSFDVTIKDSDKVISALQESKRLAIGPKICQFRSA